MENALLGIGDTIKNGVLDAYDQSKAKILEAGDVLKNSLVSMFTDFLTAFKRSQSGSDSTMMYLLIAAAGIGGYYMIKK
jgi:hypothetical protein